MEDRRELSDLLLAGLGEVERRQTIETMRQAALARLRRLRAADHVDHPHGDPVDLT